MTATSSVALKVLIGTDRLVEVLGMVKAVMVGEVVSGKEITTLSFLLAEMFPAAS